MTEAIDLHTHSAHSFDGHDSIDSLCESAVEKGIRVLAVTDHCDIDGEIDNYYRRYDSESARKDIDAAREKYSGKLELLYGLELGQGYTYPEESRKLCEERRFDFVLASVHNLAGAPDFYYLNYEKMDQRYIDYLWERYLREIAEKLIPLRKKMYYTSLAHLTYPLRYVRNCGRDIDTKKYYYDLIEVFKKMIEYGIALEINTSGIRKYLGETLPGPEFVKLYRQCGGEYLTVGSDAHYAKDVGADISAGYEIAKEAGFERITWLGRDGERSVKL